MQSNECLLSYMHLLKLIEGGVIENCPVELVNQASVDVTLGPEIMVESRNYTTISWSLREKPRMIKRQLPYTLKAGEFILASSQQVFNLPNWLSAEYKLKSGMARCGLNHLNAGWCDAGWHGSVLTLELVNVTSRHSIVLNTGDRIGQMVFFKHDPVPDAASYATKGRYNNDKTVTATKE